MRIVILLILAILWNSFVIITIVDLCLIGFARPVIHRKVNQEHFLIQKKNRIDFQEHFECSGYSSAYVLRHFGIQEC